ncbi:MAG: phosphatidate cytidylyltransferase [Defluviitaleaceae bacterium]|nr:phosphatidate cytidylyltransferase [Defluviitaleaceae bacterium]
MMLSGGKRSAFFQRTLTALIGLPAVIYLVHIGSWPLLVVVGGFALAALREFYIAFSEKDKPVHFIGYFFTIGYFTAIHFFGMGQWLLITLVLFMVTVQTALIIFYRQLPLRECVSTVYGFLYVPFLLAFLVLVRQHVYGQYFVWLIFTAAFVCDTFAYLVGSAIGRRKLKNSPSPSKSLEGLVGGILGAGFIGFIYGFVLTRFVLAYDPTFNFILVATATSFLGAIFSIIGDMAASAVKRFCGIKDFSNVFPGHGGVLDRVDSILVVAPVIFVVVTLLV